MSAIAVPFPNLSTTSPEVIEKLVRAQNKLRDQKQVGIHTGHVIHGGMYARTISMPPNVVVVGALVKVPTMVITVGSARVLVDKDWAEVDGYQVLPASKNRKQIFVSRGPFLVTMIFPTKAKTVEAAEKEFTDEAELLLSRTQDLNTSIVTGE